MEKQSNAKKADLNYQTYLHWREGETLESLARKYLQRRKNGDVIEHKLGRNKITKVLKIGNAINQNGDIRDALIDLDKDLLEAGLRDADVPVDPPSDGAEGETNPSTAQPTGQGGFSAADRARLNELEEENAYLKEELKEKNARMKKYGLVDKILTDTMRWPR